MLAGAVTIITTNGAAGKGGFTATAVCSVTDSPPSLLFCINRKNELLKPLLQNGSFVVNILSHEHEALSNRFAGYDEVTMEQRLEKGNWQNMSGQLYLPNALLSIRAEVAKADAYGSHTIVIGEIAEIIRPLAENNNGPLMYYNTRYHQLRVEDISTNAK